MSCRPVLLRLTALACLSLAGVAPAMAQESADPVDTAFHLDDASLPDPIRSPGGTSPGLTDEDLCTAPAEEFAGTPPAALCDEVFAEYRISPEHRFQYQCAFLVPPTIGGSDAKTNVWLQPTNEAALKRATDKEVRKQVCNHGIGLSEAQKLLSTDWVGLYRKFFRANDKLLPIAKAADKAPASFDGPPPLPVPPGASPRAYLDNGGLNDGGGIGDTGSYGDSGAPASDDRRDRRHRRLQDGDRKSNGRTGSRFGLHDPGLAGGQGRTGPGGVRPKDVRPNDVRPNDIRPREIRPNDVRPNDVRANDVRPNDIRPKDARPNDVRPDSVRPNDPRPRAGERMVPRFPDGTGGRPDPSTASRDPREQPGASFRDDRERASQRGFDDRRSSLTGGRDDFGRSARAWPARPGPVGSESRSTFRPAPAAAQPRAGISAPRRGAMLRQPGGRGLMRSRRR